MDAAGSDWDDLVATALPRVRGLAATSERDCCLPVVALDLLLAGASTPPPERFAADESLGGSAGTGKQQSGNCAICIGEAIEYRP